MTLIVGNVMDVGLAGLDGTLRVWAWFRPEEVGLIAPYRREWDIIGGQIEAGVDVIPGPAVVEIDVGLDAFRTIEVTVPDAPEVTIQDLFEQVYTWSPRVVSEAWEARLGAEAAAVAAEESAGEAGVSAGRALTSEEAAALHAATLSARVEQPGQDILYTSDGKPYFADPAQIENVPLTVDTSVGTRVMLGDQMIHGDTGLRDVSSLLIYGWTGNILLARQGNRVTMKARITSPNPLERDWFCTAPLGFRHASGYKYVEMPMGWGRNNRLDRRFVIGQASAWFFAGGQYGTHDVDTEWVTDDPWPTSLPGTPA